MQKKLIALAVAGLVSAPAFAQSNVTIYGVADAFIGAGSQGDVDLIGVESAGLSGNRLGFRGTEDLGNGLKAVFTLEQGFTIDDGGESDSSKAFQRQAFVGLSGGFGTVALGRQYAPGYYIVNDPLASGALSPHVMMVNDAGMTIAPNSAARWDNALTYTGSFSGLTVRANYAMGAGEAVNTATGIDPEDDDRFGLSVAYANGPLNVDAIYHLIQTSSSAVTADDQKEWYVSAGYNFGMATVMASYQDGESLGKPEKQRRQRLAAWRGDPVSVQLATSTLLTARWNTTTVLRVNVDTVGYSLTPTLCRSAPPLMSATTTLVTTLTPTLVWLTRPTLSSVKTPTCSRLACVTPSNLSPRQV